jgi:BirA family biotin operon repressor/biotin-[acetyl-CoA-carboxylase] ligase
MQLAKTAINQPHIEDFIPTVITAECQTAGKGRNGHKWWSPRGAGLYAAFIIPLDEYHEFMTLWLGTAIVRELRRYTRLDIHQVGINDIYLDNRKLGGVLCEAYKKYSIVGIGLNIIRPVGVIPELQNTAVWLDEYSADRLLARADLINVLAEAIVK